MDGFHVFLGIPMVEFHKLLFRSITRKTQGDERSDCATNWASAVFLSTHHQAQHAIGAFQLTSEHS
jgi:hypothetical protein